MASHVQLLRIVKQLPEDYIPYGNNHRDDGEEFGMDCSSGCKFYHKLSGKEGADWGVCTNPKSHRCGLLTFEHQGCRKYE